MGTLSPEFGFGSGLKSFCAKSFELSRFTALADNSRGKTWVGPVVIYGESSLDAACSASSPNLNSDELQTLTKNFST